ncbi:MAG: hypothetical protein SHS37scaffold145_40 [Phage 71_18]|nr:MAG: hypothetical protein SHS37scaffold145_40 [Phage 71_18]
MPLLNYTTTIAPAKTLADMQAMLVKAGAAQVMAAYEAGRPTGLTFVIDTAHGARTFSLPVDPAPVEALLRRDREVPNRYKTHDQAERVGWRILKDWLEAQLALIATQMVTLDQVMLPYMVVDELGTTVWGRYQLSAGALELNP